MNDQEKFIQALARASVGQIPVADKATHERIAQETIAAHPELVERARTTGNYVPLVRQACSADPKRLVEFWMAQRIGQIVRENAPSPLATNTTGGA